MIEQEENYIFKYKNPEIDDAKKVGFQYFPGFEDTSKIYENQRLFSNITTRLPNKRREDYLDILNRYGLDVTASEFEILTATKGRLITDNFEFVKEFDKNNIEFDIAGTSHSKDLNKCLEFIKENDKVYLIREESNVADPNAIKIVYNYGNNSYHLGYVPRYYSSYLSTLLQSSEDYSAIIKKMNIESTIKDEMMNVEVRIIFR